ncbi:MAG: DUF4440 domain-containing protein [Chthonomonadaceae bacterium]|nr:DUF4440 domain-containing protein [Chthonomonadaceae bacterium]
MPLEAANPLEQVRTLLSVVSEEFASPLSPPEISEDLSFSALPQAIVPSTVMEVTEKSPFATPERVLPTPASLPATLSDKKNLLKVGIGAGGTILSILLIIWGGRIRENRAETERQQSIQRAALQTQIEETKATSEKVLRELTEMKQRVTSSPSVEPPAPSAPTTSSSNASEDEGPEPASNHNSEEANLNAQKAATSLYSDWSTAWQKRDLEGYLKCYAPDALIKRVHKSPYQIGELRAMMRSKWAKERSIEITDYTLTWKVKGNTARATAFQRYDSTTWWDEGIKTLILKKRDGEWKITEESFERHGGGAKSALPLSEQVYDD